MNLYNDIEDDFIHAFKQIQIDVHKNAVNHKFWEGKPNIAEKIALIHSELSEALEYARKDFHSPSNHIPIYTGVEEELADVIIRVMDMAEHYNLKVADALIVKAQYNKTRSEKHGKKF